MHRLLRSALALSFLSLGILGPGPALAADEGAPAAAAADSRGPAITFLQPAEPARPQQPPETARRRAELRRKWESATAEERAQALEALRKYVAPEVQRAYADYLETRQPSPAAGGSLAFEDDAGMTVSVTALPASGAAPLAVTLQATAYDPEGPVYQFSWNFGDGQTGAGSAVAHTYSAPGTYWATVLAFGSGSSSGWAQALIQVTPGGGGGGGGGGDGNLAPQVTLSASPDEGAPPLVISASASGYDPDGWIASYVWDFGDGGWATTASASHTYQAEGTYTARVTVTDDRGAQATAAALVEVASNVDSDGDGLPDRTERKLANQFMPGYFLSLFEFPGTGMARFADNPNEQVPVQVFPTVPPTPHVYYRVAPLEVSGGKSYVQVDYLSLWNRDDSLVLGSVCLSDLDVLDFFGIWSPQFGIGLGGHAIDNERSILRLVAPASAGGINTKAGAYKVDCLFAAGHEDTFFDTSQRYVINPPQGPEVHYALWPSLSKHATYGFVPHGLPLLPAPIIGAIRGGVAFTCLLVSPDTCDLLWFIADEVIFDCITEKHVPGLGGVQPSAANRVNVGEPDNPAPGASFIQVEALRGKFQKTCMP